MRVEIKEKTSYSLVTDLGCQIEGYLLERKSRVEKILDNKVLTEVFSCCHTSGSDRYLGERLRTAKWNDIMSLARRVRVSNCKSYIPEIGIPARKGEKHEKNAKCDGECSRR